MQKDRDQLESSRIGTSSREDSHRHSLPPKRVTDVRPSRLTQSQNFKKRVKVPPIPEQEGDADEGREKEVRISVDAVNEQVKISRGSKVSRKGSQASRMGIENAAFEIEEGGRISRGNSAGSSVRSSVRDPSLQSFTVVRQQYWCCSRWTRFERNLCCALLALIVIIVALLLTVGLLAGRGSQKRDNSTVSPMNVL